MRSVNRTIRVPMDMEATPPPLNFTTYLNPSSASANAGNEPPSLRGCMYRVTVTVRIVIILESKSKILNR